jgi:uncharacterized protein YdeI (YjbR/CyaY-like superfamily)
MNTESVDAFLRDGCGRCAHYKSPQCKVRQWPEILRALRELVLSSGLHEEMKWGSPCYTLNGKNVVMIAAQRKNCALSFCQGAFLADTEGLLEAPGPNSRWVRYLKFQTLDDLFLKREATLAFLAQAIALESSGVKLQPAAAEDPVPDELAQRLLADPHLQRAFHALTPGRKRSHILYIGGAKQAETRRKRVERCVERILQGMGFNER